MIGVFLHVYLMLTNLLSACVCVVFVCPLLHVLTMCLWLFVVVGLALVLVALTASKYICVCMCALNSCIII